MKSSPPTGDKVFPLSSTTILRQARPSLKNTTTDYSSVRLNTYHDTSDLRAALRKIELAFAPVEPSGVARSEPVTAVSGANTNVSRATLRQPKLSEDTKSRPTIVIVKRSERKPLESLRRRQPEILRLPPNLLIRCCSFCDLRTLGVLCCVSVRMNALVAHQGSELWLAAAQRRRIPIALSGHAREELRRVLVERARERHAEEAYYEAEIARMEERLSAHSQDIFAQNIDVKRTLDMYGASSTPAADKPFWLNQRHRPVAQANGARAPIDAATSAPSSTTEMCAKLRAEIEALEEVKRICHCRLKLQEEILLDQDGQLRKWQAALLPCDRAGCESTIPSVSERLGKVAPRKENDATTATDASATEMFVSTAQIDEFERRMVRLVLNSSTSDSLAAGGDAPSGQCDLPLVLRRGVESFADLELVLRTLRRDDASAETASAKYGAALTGNMEGTAANATAAAASRCEGALRAATKRWSAFQKICPINEEYANARLLIKTQSMQNISMPGENVRSNLHCRQSSYADKQQQQRITSRYMPAVLRLSAFIRRVETMSDSQVVREWM